MDISMRFHALSLPHTVTNHDYVGCAYTQKVLKFCKMMTNLGHTTIHYGHEDSNLVCSEHVTVITNSDLEIAYGNYDWRKNFFKFDLGDHAYQTFYKNAIVEVGKRKQKNDFILPFWGAGTRAVCDAHQDMICVEPGIGYSGGHWAKYKIFESYAIYHAYYGLESVGQCKQSWYDAVIPNYFDPDDFEYRKDKEDYFLFLGRIYEGKGIHVAIQVTKEIGAKLLIAGQNSLKQNGYDPVPDHVVELGYADRDTRKKLMAGAKGAFVASIYNEPFGGVQVEMLMSGTPTITTDWGAFTENNLHGVTGYRCKTFDHFVWAAKNIHKIDPANCRKWAMNFSIDKVAKMYEEYFQEVMDVHTNKGWYEIHHDRKELDWMNKMDVFLPKQPNLTDIFIKHGTDKTGVEYGELFEPLRHKKIRVFEMGVAGYPNYKPGASIRAWKEYFTHPETEVYAGDIDPTICDGKTIFEVDQMNPEQVKALFDKLGKFDIIIDDGLHTTPAAQKFFDASRGYLKENGIYVVDDIENFKMKGFQKKKCGPHDNFLGIYRNKKAKVGIWSEGKWAHGRVHRNVMKHLKDDFEFHFHDWGQNCSALWDNWRDYDVLMGTTALTYHQIEVGYLKEIPPEMRKKILAVKHAENTNTSQFKENMGFKDAAAYGAISLKIGEEIADYNPNFMPIGFDPEEFPEMANKPTGIKTIGQVSTRDHNKEYLAIKRPQWLSVIAKGSGVDFKHLNGFDMSDTTKIYEGIDMLVVTSSTEGAGLSMVEAAAMGIPVITTKVGYGNMLKNIKTFDTPEQATQLINHFKEHPDELVSYRDALTKEVREDWNWEYLANKFWKPVIKNIIDNQ